VLQVLLIVGRQHMSVFLASRPLILLLILTAGGTHARRKDRTAVSLLTACAAIGGWQLLGIG
jgi:hypothetical protein